MAELIIMKICYMFVAFCEMGMGIAIINKIYPEFRYDSRTTKFLSIVLLGMFGLIYAWNSWLFYISTSFMLLASVVLATLYCLFWHSNFLNILLLQLFYYINISILKVPILTMRGIKCHENVIQANQGPRTFGEVSFILLILLLIHILLKHHKNVEVVLKKLFKKNTILCIVIVILEWLMLCYCMRNGQFEFEKQDVISNLLIIMSTAMLMFSIVLFYTYQQVKYENALQQERYRCLKSQYYEMKELYEANSRWSHDVKHELLFVGNCLKENNISGAYESIQGYLQKIMQTEKRVWSSFSFLDFMLNYKKAEMDKHNIKFMLDIELQHIEMLEEDLVIILGNLLDNAVEATIKCEKERRCINLKIRNLNDMLLLSIENSNFEMPKLKKDTFISSKTDKGMHGWGIESVKQIVEKYNGEIHFQYTEKLFQVQILL